VNLRVATPDAWLRAALADPLAVLGDHAHCEKKAAASALSLISAYPERSELVRAMGALAREEAGHFLKVHEALIARGGTLPRDVADPYVNDLLTQVRHDTAGRLVDRLLISALIEARSHERLELLAQNLADPDLRALYAELARAEVGHAALFVRLAGPDAGRLDELLELEGALVLRMPVRAAIH
jgi:tRNA-(ms[2]io[6]A)-hydroxylase